MVYSEASRAYKRALRQFSRRHHAAHHLSKRQSLAHYPHIDSHFLFPNGGFPEYSLQRPEQKVQERLMLLPVPESEATGRFLRKVEWNASFRTIQVGIGSMRVRRRKSKT